MFLSSPFPTLTNLLRVFASLVPDTRNTASLNRLHLEELSKSIAAGDHDAFDEFYKQTQQPILRYILKMTKDQNTAVDLLQDVYIKLWEARNKLPDITDTYSYLVRLTHNHVMSYFKKIGTYKFIQLNGDTNLLDIPFPEDQAESEQLLDLLRATLNDFPERQKLAFELQKFSGLSRSQIAEQLGISEETVKSYLKNSMKTLRMTLKPQQHQ